MSKSTGGFVRDLDRVGAQDAAREIHRAKLAKRREIRDAHETRESWVSETKRRKGWK